MSKSQVWLKEHITSLATFFIALETHHIHFTPHRNWVAVTYAAHVRCEWYNMLKIVEGFNLGLIDEKLMRNKADKVKDAKRDRS